MARNKKRKSSSLALRPERWAGLGRGGGGAGAGLVWLRTSSETLVLLSTEVADNPSSTQLFSVV